MAPLQTSKDTAILDAPSYVQPAAVAGAAPMMMPSAALRVGFEIGLEPEATQNYALAQPDARERHRQGFRVGAYALMIRYEDGRELTEMPAIYRLPNSPDWFMGMANLNGVPTPVFELALYLGIDSGSQQKKKLLVLSRGIDAAGVVIDGLPERLKCSDSDRVDSSMIPARLTPHHTGAYLINEQLWFDIQCDSLLDALEQDIKAGT